MFKNKKMVSNQYFRFDRIIDNDNVVIISSDLRFVKGQGVLVTANNKAVYLKPWQVQAVTNWEILGGETAYAIKLNRNFFKPYQFRFEFQGMSIAEADELNTFDDVMRLAEEQQKKNMRIKTI